MTKLKSYYFPHDYQARNDPKLLWLRDQFGLAALGAYWQLIEILHENANAVRTHANGERTQCERMLSIQLGCTEIELHEFLNGMAQVSLITLGEEYISSERVAKNLKLKEQKSELARQAANKRYQDQDVTANAVRTHADDLRTHAIKEKKIKENKREKAPAPIGSQASLLLAPEKIKPVKLNFGEEGKVLLTAEEHQKLKTQLGAEKLESCISLLNDFVGAKKKDPYASHYHAIKKWVVEAVEAKKGNPKVGSRPWSALDTLQHNLKVFKSMEENEENGKNYTKEITDFFSDGKEIVVD